MTKSSVLLVLASFISPLSIAAAHADGYSYPASQEGARLYYEAGENEAEFSPVTYCHTDSIGFSLCDDGTSGYTDSIGNSLYSNGVSAHTDSNGFTSRSDGRNCSSYGGGNSYCQ